MTTRPDDIDDVDDTDADAHADADTDTDAHADTDESPARSATPRSELWLYAGAALSYIVCGFFVKQIFAWWWFGAAWFVAFVWWVPQLVTRLRREGRSDDRVDTQ